MEQMVLIDIQKLLESMQKYVKMYPLPNIDDTYDPSSNIPREIFEEASVETSVDGMALSKTLNEEQQAAYNEIMSVVDSDHGGLFFVDGPGGTGKTYLYRALLATICSQNKIVMAIATSGVAASIMPGGRTAHSRFKIPVTLDDGAFCSFTKQSGTAKLLRTASLIIWDEVTMMKRQGVEALDNSLHDIMDCPNLSFDWKTMVFGGDFEQTQSQTHKFTKQVIWKSLTINRPAPAVGCYQNFLCILINCRNWIQMQGYTKIDSCSCNSKFVQYNQQI
ncbi:uncharacterized protein [Miscanthus floridulus]|uniref:uncharacterized protein n=1 Tax=Miscanthus floridulus TaxID=154761 RepID=UPI003458DC63